MKITIDVSEFWLHEETLEEGLKSHIAETVVKTVDETIKNLYSEEVRNQVEKLKSEKISKLIDSVIENDTIEDRRSSNDIRQISIREHIKKKFSQQSGWSSPNNQIEKLAKQFSQEMKNRYDLAFASQIVIKMNEQGLLKDGVAEALLKQNQ